MAPRRAARRQPPTPRARPAPWGTLPDDLLEKVLGEMTLEERQRAALVCKQWHRVSLSPELLRHLEINCWTEGWLDFWYQSLLSWLMRHRPARHAHSTNLHFSLANRRSCECEEERSLVAACLTAVATSAGPQLKDLIVNADCGSFTTLGWIAGLTSLTRLTLSNNQGKLYLTQSLTCLRELRELRLACEGWVDSQGLYTPLPPCISRLELETPNSEMLLHIPTTLTNLRTINLENCGYFEEGMGGLVALKTLRHLCISETRLPTCLSSLKFLRSLHLVEHPDEDDFSALPEVLPALKQLTALALDSLSLNFEELAPALDQLPRLERLLCSGCGEAYARAGELLPTRLHGGPLFSRLRWLALDWELLLHNPQLLAGAAQLETLCLLGSSHTEPGAKYGRLWAPFWRQCERLPALRRILLHVWNSQLVSLAQPLPALLKGAAALQGKRPEVGCPTVSDPAKGTGALLFPDAA